MVSFDLNPNVIRNLKHHIICLFGGDLSKNTARSYNVIPFV